jgi:hypothetical protein
VTPFSVNETESTLGQHRCRVKASDAGKNNRAFLSFDEFVMERGGVPSRIPLLESLRISLFVRLFVGCGYDKELRNSGTSVDYANRISSNIS